jgi:hypothetical protein
VTKPPERTDDARYVLVTNELIEMLQGGWSVPVQLKIVAEHGNELELTVRLVDTRYNPDL